MIQVVGAVMHQDYFAEGRTLDTLGIGDLDRGELLDFLDGGTD